MVIHSLTQENPPEAEVSLLFPCSILFSPRYFFFSFSYPVVFPCMGDLIMHVPLHPERMFVLKLLNFSLCLSLNELII